MKLKIDQYLELEDGMKPLFRKVTRANIAGQAMAALIKKDDSMNPQRVAIDAVAYADCLLQVLEQGE